MFLFVGGKANEDKEAGMKQWMDWMGNIAKMGKLDSGDVFAPQGKRVSGAMNISAYDGMEANATSGYLIVKADTLDQATELVKGCPLLTEGGTVEVRELMNMKM